MIFYYGLIGKVPDNNLTKMRAVLFLSFHFVAFLLLLMCPLGSSWRSFKIVFTRFDYEANAKLVDVKIDIKNSSDGALNIVTEILEVLNDVELTASIALETDQGNYTNLLTRSMNFCKMLKERNADPLSRMIYQDLLRHGNMMKECPIEKGTYKLEDYRVDEELLPSYLPETNFKFSVRLTKPKGDQIFKGMLYGRVDKSKGFNNLKMFSMG